jgi:predicted transposase/invertase (TIGR01784 family)
MLQKNVDRWIEEWKAEGEAKGHAEGKAEGEANERRRVAKELFASGMTLSQISKITKLSEKELEELRNSVAN